MVFHRQCPYCGKEEYKEIGVTAEQIVSWHRGTLIQNAMPETSPEEREFLKTGICEECWNVLFGDTSYKES